MPAQPPGQLRYGPRGSDVIAYARVWPHVSTAEFFAWARYYRALVLTESERPPEDYCEKFHNVVTDLAFSRQLRGEQAGAGELGPGPWPEMEFVFWWVGEPVPIPPDGATATGEVDAGSPVVAYTRWSPTFSCPYFSAPTPGYKPRPPGPSDWACVALFVCPRSFGGLPGRGKHGPGPALSGLEILRGARRLATGAPALCKCPPVRGEPLPPRTPQAASFTAADVLCGTLPGYDYFPLSTLEEILRNRDDCLDRVLFLFDSGASTERQFLENLCRCDEYQAAACSRVGTDLWCGSPEGDEDEEPEYGRAEGSLVREFVKIGRVARRLARSGRPAFRAGLPALRARLARARSAASALFRRVRSGRGRAGGR